MYCSRTLAMIFAGFGLICLQPASGASYDAVHDYAGSNPNGVWTYGSLTGASGPDFSTFATLDSFQTDAVPGAGPCDPAIPAGPCGVNSWSGDTAGSPVIAANTTGNYVQYLTLLHPFYDLLMYPGATEYADLRWTAPADGYWVVSAQFEGIDFFSDGPTVDVFVFLNTEQILYSQIAGSFGSAVYWTPSGRQFFHEGDTVDFVVGSQGNNLSDGTGLSASFSDIPEPASVLLFATGLLLLPALKRRVGGRS